MTKKPILRMLKGLPASGKSTYAKELEETGEWVRTNKDDIRKAYFPDWTFKDEKEVIYIQDCDIEAELSAGSNVVVDDTNFNPKHEVRLKKLAKDNNAEFEVLFIDTALEECIQRNKKRPNSVPQEVILDMYKKYVAPFKEEHVKYDDSLDEAIIVDIDGTLAHISGSNPRNPYDASRAMEDTLDDAVSLITAMCYNNGYRVIILTGRHSGHLSVTEEWLDANGVSYDEIHCRDENDKRPDYIIKEELFDKYVRGKYNVKFVMDDRPQVVRLWESLGLKVLMPAYPWKEF